MSASPGACSTSTDRIPDKLNEDLTVDKLAIFLEKKENIPFTFCQKLKGTLLNSAGFLVKIQRSSF